MKKTVAALLAVMCLFSFCSAETLTVFNWYDYIDENVIAQFEDETGIEVKYANFTTNEEMYAKLSAGGNDYDVIFPSDYIIERMIKENGLAKLDLNNMPNVQNVCEWLKKPAYDPTGEFSVPYMWGTVGILYNTDLVDGDITSWSSVFEADRKSVFMLDSIRDSLGVALKYLGYSMNTRDEAALQAAKELLLKQKSDGIVKGYLVDEVKDKMISGEAPMAVMWSGDALYAMSEAEELKYVVPSEGSNVWVDGMCVPAASKHIKEAEQFIDFLCRPDIARANMEYIYYSTPIQTVIDEMDDEEKNNLTLNPTQEIIDNCEFFNDISEDMDMYSRIWLEIRGG